MTKKKRSRFWRRRPGRHLCSVRHWFGHYITGIFNTSLLISITSYYS